MATKEASDVKTSARPVYKRPEITVMDENQVLIAFQMTAAEISAAGCWWSSSACHR